MRTMSKQFNYVGSRHKEFFPGNLFHCKCRKLAYWEGMREKEIRLQCKQYKLNNIGDLSSHKNFEY